MLSLRSATRTGRAAAACIAVVVVFQLLLASELPLGRAAWGGANDVLSPSLRISSAFAVIIWTGATLLILGRAGAWGSERWQSLQRRGAWFLVALLGFGALLNFASSSPWERFGWGPFGVVMTVLCFRVARARAEPPQSQ
jgi:hypothetical protein